MGSFILKRVFQRAPKVWAVNGNSTIEYVFIMPIVLAVVLAVVQGAVYLKDRAQIQALARNTADALARLWYYEPFPLEGSTFTTLDSNSGAKRELYGELKFWESGDKEEAARAYITGRLEEMGYDTTRRSLKDGVDVFFHRRILSSSIEVRIKVPFRLAAGGILGFLGGSEAVFVTGVSEKTLTDTPEFIRNTDYVVQLVEKTPVKDLAEKVIAPVRGILDKIIGLFKSN